MAVDAHTTSGTCSQASARHKRSAANSMRSFPIPSSLPDDFRILKMVRLLGEQSFICLIRLWSFTAEHRASGMLSGMDACDIARAAGWDGDSERFTDMLVTLGFLSSVDDEYSVHGWVEEFEPISRLDVSPTAWKRLRQRVFERDNHTCVYCGSKPDKLECDHVYPLSRGGKSSMSNLVAACPPCNRAKRDKTPEEWRAQ